MREFRCANLHCDLPDMKTQYEEDHLLEALIRKCARCRENWDKRGKIACKRPITSTYKVKT